MVPQSLVSCQGAVGRFVGHFADTTCRFGPLCRAALAGPPFLHPLPGERAEVKGGRRRPLVWTLDRRSVVWLDPPAATQQGSRAHQGRSSTQVGPAPTPTPPGAETDQGGRRPPHSARGEGGAAAAHAIGGRPDRGRPGGTQGGTDRARRTGGGRTGRPLTRRTGRTETGRHDQPARGPRPRRAEAAGDRARRRRSGGPWGAGRPAATGGDPAPIGQAAPDARTRAAGDPRPPQPGPPPPARRRDRDRRAGSAAPGDAPDARTPGRPGAAGTAPGGGHGAPHTDEAPGGPHRGRRGHGPGDGPPTARAGAHEPRRRRAAPAGASRAEPFQGGAPSGARGPEAPDGSIPTRRLGVIL